MCNRILLLLFIEDRVLIYTRQKDEVYETGKEETKVPCAVRGISIADRSWCSCGWRVISRVSGKPTRERCARAQTRVLSRHYEFFVHRVSQEDRNDIIGEARALVGQWSWRSPLAPWKIDHERSTHQHQLSQLHITTENERNKERQRKRDRYHRRSASSWVSFYQSTKR